MIKILSGNGVNIRGTAMQTNRHGICWIDLSGKVCGYNPPDNLITSIENSQDLMRLQNASMHKAIRPDYIEVGDKFLKANSSWASLMLPGEICNSAEHPDLNIAFPVHVDFPCFRSNADTYEVPDAYWDIMHVVPKFPGYQIAMHLGKPQGIPLHNSTKDKLVRCPVVMALMLNGNITCCVVGLAHLIGTSFFDDFKAQMEDLYGPGSYRDIINFIDFPVFLSSEFRDKYKLTWFSL